MCISHLPHTCYMSRIFVNFVFVVIGEEQKLWSLLMIVALDTNVVKINNTGGLNAWMYGENVTGNPTRTAGQTSMSRAGLEPYVSSVHVPPNAGLGTKCSKIPFLDHGDVCTHACNCPARVTMFCLFLNKSDAADNRESLCVCMPQGRMTTLQPSLSRLSRENVGASTSHSPMGLHGLLQG
jgi:hypothetical protein